jgi:RES domain-containing protein
VTPLPAALGGKDLVAWRLDRDVHAATWDGGEGAYRAGGRWNSKGVRAVYASLDPSTAILEVAVHKGFDALDSVPHVLTSLIITDTTSIHVVKESDVPNKNWLRPVSPGAAQQAFGDNLLKAHRFVVIPSAVSNRSWNLIFLKSSAAGAYRQMAQEPFSLDTRLNRPRP